MKYDKIKLKKKVRRVIHCVWEAVVWFFFLSFLRSFRLHLVYFILNWTDIVCVVLFGVRSQLYTFNWTQQEFSKLLLWQEKQKWWSKTVLLMLRNGKHLFTYLYYISFISLTSLFWYQKIFIWFFVDVISTSRWPMQTQCQETDARW